VIARNLRLIAMGFVYSFGAYQIFDTTIYSVWFWVGAAWWAVLAVKIEGRFFND
jgi:hypothetical protein